MREVPKSPRLGIIIPVYNEQEVLPALLERLNSLVLGLPLSILFVDDGSTDRTLAMLQEACKRDARLACLSFSRNFGQQAALVAGLRYVRGDVVAVLDADLQDPPELLNEFLAKWREGYDVVYGIRKNRKEHWALRAAYKSFYWLLSRVSSIHLPRDAGDFALIDRKVVDTLNTLSERNRFNRGLRGWVGFRQVGVPYDRPARQAGRTKYNLTRLCNVAIDGLLSFSAVPLRISGWLGAAAALLGFGFLVYILALFVLRQPLPDGWASTIVVILFLGGIQLIVLGIIGEYLGRISEEVKRRPHFVAQSRLGWLSESEDDA